MKKVGFQLRTSTLHTFPLPRSNNEWFASRISYDTFHHHTSTTLSRHDQKGNQLNSERIQTPRVALPHEPQDRAEVVAEHATTEPRAVDQPRGLEDVLFLVEQLFCACGVGRRYLRGVDVGSAFVQLKELVRNVLRSKPVNNMIARGT